MRLAVVLTGVVRCVVNGGAPIAQLAEAVDLKSIQCGFESHWGHNALFAVCAVQRVVFCRIRLFGDKQQKAVQTLLGDAMPSGHDGARQ